MDPANQSQLEECTSVIGGIAREAGRAILEVYERADLGVETKSDDSPLTAADLASHNIIVDALASEFPDIPVMSEESASIAWEERRTWQLYFLVDPLDGTKEFINRNGEFTVNIALVEAGVPIAGIVYVPVKDLLYAGIAKGSPRAWLEAEGTTRSISARNLASRDELVVVASRRHGSEAQEACMARLNDAFGNVATRNMGSSLKLCLVAAGEADLYPRLAPTSEWDTAAAHAVVLGAGGDVVNEQLEPLRYNQRDEVLNPYFYVIADPAFAWKQILVPDASGKA